MSFGTGTTAGVISRTTNNSAQTADKTDETGKITEMTTFGATKEVITETFADAAGDAATSGQTGTTATTRDDFTETNESYARKSTTVRTVNI
jgi:hypothetical protein